MFRFLRILCLLVFCAFTAFTVNADTVMYTFEPPQFTNGEFTSIFNRPPNIGPSTFLASFLTGTNAYRVEVFQGNGLFSGQSLVSQHDTNPLTINLNMPVTQVQFVWAQEQPGLIRFLSSGVEIVQNSAVVGGGAGLPGGTFIFSSETPFTTFTLNAFAVNFAPLRFDIDNLVLTTPTPASVPEPATMLLFGTALAGIVIKVRKHRKAV